MVWCGDCGGGIWRRVACIGTRGQRWDLDKPVGSSARRVDQPMGSWSGQMDKSMGAPPRSMDQPVVSDALDAFACPRKFISL
jgi:hypothetical protein